jgi:HSP20 family protein
MSNELEQVKKQSPETYTDSERTRDRRVYVPAADIYETEDAMFIVTDVPGTDQANVEVTLEKNVLTITAYPIEETFEGLSLVYSEYGYGDLERRFVLSNAIDQEKIEANVQNGVLTLRLPKAGPAKSRKIIVQGA